MATLDLAALDLLLTSLSLSPLASTTFPSSDPLHRPLDIARTYLAHMLQSIVENCGVETAWGSIVWPGDIYIGDLAAVLPKLIGKKVAGGSEGWSVLAFELIQKFPHCPLFMFPFPEGVHIRFNFAPQTLYRIMIPYILERGPSYGGNSSVGRIPETQSQKRILLEFSSPNLATPFAPRHLRSTLIGIYLSNLYASMGYSVTRINYLGDWGKQIALLGVGFSKFGSEAEMAADPIKHLDSVYARIEDLFKPEQVASKKARDDKTGEEAEIESQGLFKERNEWFAHLEDGREEEVSFWKRVRGGFVEHYEGLYERLGVKFDEYTGESAPQSSTMMEVERILKEKGVLEEDNTTRSWIVDLKKHGGKKSGVCIIRDRSGSSTYLLRDLAAMIERERRYEGDGGFEKMVYVVQADQHVVHFQRVGKLLELMGMEALAAKLLHVSFAEVLGTERIVEEGDLGLLESLLEKSKTAVETSWAANEEKAALMKEKYEGGEGGSLEVMGVNALLVQELAIRRGTDYTLDLEKSSSFETGTGLDLLYWHARLSSLLKEDEGIAGLSIEYGEEELEDEDQSNLLRLLVQYPDIVSNAYKTLESAQVVVYLVNLTGQLSACLETEEEADAEVEGEKGNDNEEGESTGEEMKTGISPVERKLYESTRVVLENGMKLLGLRGIGKSK